MSTLKIESIDLPDDVTLQVKAVIDISQERLKLYADAFPDQNLSDCKNVVICQADNEEGDQVDYIVKQLDDGPQVVVVECKISYEEVSPTQLVEYQFKEGGTWYLAHVALPSLEYYRKSKYEIWKNMLLKPTCEAALKRMLKTGIITDLFDDQIFITPEDEIKDYQVVDDHGKEVRIPHPVHALRVWDSTNQNYKTVSSHLEGAPEDKEGEDVAWKAFLEQLGAEHGAEYIESLMA